MQVVIISLGCPKNQVDGDIIAHQILKAGHTTITDLTKADLCVINTCGFITSAKEEAIENILMAANAKKENEKLKIIVTGCLAERYKDEIIKDIPEVDAVVGIGKNKDILDIIGHTFNNEQVTYAGAKADLDITAKRIISTPKHFAYLKIAEGCSNCCHYCAIPLIRGPHRSRAFESCIEEAKWLAEEGVKEVIIVAQDITAYGEDLYGKRRLAELLEEISKVDGIQWIRLMYAYPERLDDDVINVMANNDKVLPYIDLPIQHINDRVLTSMNRKGGTDVIKSAIDRLTKAIPDIVIRTSLITGYPGETQEEFEELLEYVKQTKFGRLGCFAYSEEEDTVAASMDGQIDPEIRQQRANTIMQVQTNIMAESQAAMVGKTIQVICDDFDEENNLYICRSVYDSPEIDGEVYLSGDSNIEVGDIVNALVEKSDVYDLYAKLV